MLRRGARDLARAIAGVVDARSGAASRAGDALQRLHVARGPRSSSPRDATASSTALLSSSSDASGGSSPRMDVWRAWMGYGEGERGRRDDGTHPAGALARGHRRLRRTHAPRSTWDPERVFNDLIIKHSRRTESLLALIAGTHEDAWEIVTFENDDANANAKDSADAMPVKREWRPVNVATAANRLVNVSLRATRVPPSNRLGAALAVLRDERYALLVGMIGSTVDEFGPVETATTLKALASMQMYADNARIASPHQTLSRTSKRAAKKKEEEEEEEKTDRVDLDLAEGLARAVRRNAHRMHARLLALTLPALRLLPGVTKLIDAETHSTLARAARLAARSGVLGAVEAANVAYAMTRIPPLLRVVNEPSNRTKGDEEEDEDEEEEGAAASCAAEIAARIAETAGDMDRRCVALSLDSITRLRLGDDGGDGDGGDGHLLGTLREALGAAAARVEREVTPTRRLGSGTEWERMRAGLRRLGLEPPERWGTWPAGGGRRGERGRADGEEAAEGGPSKEGAGDE